MESQQESNPLFGNEHFFNRAPRAKIIWVSAADRETAMSPERPSVSEKTILCTICFMPTSNFSRLICGHEFCWLCLASKIHRGWYENESFPVCPAKGCHYELTKEEVIKFGTCIPKFFDRFQVIAKEKCTICWEEKPKSSITMLHCKHEFCKDCLVMQLNCACKDQTDSSLLRCPQMGCEYEFQESDVDNFSNYNKDTLGKFRTLKLRKLICENPNMRFCPGEDCDFVYEISQGKQPEQVICPRSLCGKAFCSACRDSHNPAVINCPDWTHIKNMSENEKQKATTEWIEKNTKPCPQCKERVEKNGGCQYVKCKNCQWLFCWVCGELFDKEFTGHQGSLPEHRWH